MTSFYVNTGLDGIEKGGVPPPASGLFNPIFATCSRDMQVVLGEAACSGMFYLGDRTDKERLTTVRASAKFVCLDHLADAGLPPTGGYVSLYLRTPCQVRRASDQIVYVIHAESMAYKNQFWKVLHVRPLGHEGLGA